MKYSIAAAGLASILFLFLTACGPAAFPTSAATPTILANREGPAAAAPTPAPTPTAPPPTATPTKLPPTAAPTPTPTPTTPPATATPTLAPTPTTAPPTATPTATPTKPPPTATPIPTPAPFQVTIMNFALPNITIPVGTAITWRNDDALPHTVTSGRDGKFDGTGWDSPALSTGQLFSLTLTKTGTFAYTCYIHPSLNATVTVTQSGTPSFTFPAPAAGSGGYSGY